MRLRRKIVFKRSSETEIERELGRESGKKKVEVINESCSRGWKVYGLGFLCFSMKSYSLDWVLFWVL